MLHFNYTLDNELKVAPDRLPSGIQTQAFEMAVNRLGQRFRTTVQMLSAPVAGMGGKSAIDGVSPSWQERLKTEAAFLGAIPGQLQTRARYVALAHQGNAVLQGNLERNWNLWVDAALRAYTAALKAFEKDVNRAMSNGMTNSIPAPFAKLAMIAKVQPPMLPGVRTLHKGLGHSHTLGAMPEGTPLFFGALAGLSLVGLAGWYFSRPPTPTAIGYY
jgi:hypothetical protein